MNYLLIIICIMCWGTTIILDRLSVNQMPPFLMQVIAGLVYTIYIPISLFVSNVNPFTYQWSVRSILITILATSINIVANICLFFGLKDNNNPGSFAMILSLYPIVTFILSVIFFNEAITTYKVIGFMVMIVGAVILNIK